MASDGLPLLAQHGLQEVTSFCSYLSTTYGTGVLSRDGLAALAALVLVYAAVGIIKHVGKCRPADREFEEAISVISDALELTSIQLSEMRYRLLTEFDRAKRELELARYQQHTEQRLPAPRGFGGALPAGGRRSLEST
jgi:hypothetical protein